MIEILRVCISISFRIDCIDLYKVAEQILELFPLQEVTNLMAEDSDQEGIADCLKEVQQHSILRKSKPAKEDDGEDVARMGDYYRRYRTVEELPKDARAFYEVAGGFKIFSETIDQADHSVAKNIGVDMTTLVRAVHWTEIQLDNWSLADRKRRLIDMRHNFDLDVFGSE
jgi:RNA polymerase I-specific transcription initiation factor RRN7